MNELNATTLPLAGKTLIEASAGTGKTYTIASLYLRYIVEQPFDFELTSENLLVVTFTRAATAELRERIRQRLHLALECFRGKDPGHDELLRYLVEHYQDQKHIVLKRLYAAEKTMDEAAVFTIHSFCHRAIKQNEFSSGIGSDVQLIEDDFDYVLQAAQDFWRKALYPLKGNEYDRVSGALKTRLGRIIQASPEALMASLRGFLSRKSLYTHPKALDLSVEQAIRQLLDDKQLAFSAFAKRYLSLQEVITQSLGTVKRIQKKSLAKHLDALWLWLKTGTMLSETNKAFDYVAAKAEVAGLEVSNFVEQANEFINEDELKAQLFSQALSYISQRIIEEKDKQRVQSPDDLMTVLSAALNAGPNEANTKNSTALKSALLKQYPVAMIDEFQDTDPLQFSIFDNIYGSAQDYSWMMIGDPKQSIYAFRGGDIHTYVAAKANTADDKRFTLAKNYRSTKAMVEAINQLFAGCERPAFMDEQISFDPVASQDQGKKGDLTLFGKPQAAMSFLFGETGAVQCSEKITELLNAAKDEQALLGSKIIEPGDIAILVRNRFEAKTVSEALRLKGVRSVYQSRESVYGTQVANELLRVILAFNEPRNERLLLAAMAVSCSSFSAADIAKIKQDEQLWQQQQIRFDGYHQIWNKQGILSAIHAWMFDYQVPATLLSNQLQGERRLADLLHVGELLQQLSQVLEGNYSLIRHFQQLILEPDDNNKGQQRRLESDSNLVQIITIHSSKGLEYPIVFLPYALSQRAVKDAIYVDNGQSHLDFTKAESSLEKADKERLAEDMRLLYVALTRAAYACYLGLDQLSTQIGPQDALSYLLNKTMADDPEQEQQALEAAVDSLIAKSLVSKPLISKQAARGIIDKQWITASDSSYQLKPDDDEELVAKQFTGTIDRRWRVSSYSALAHFSDSANFTPGVSDEPILDSVLVELDAISQPVLDDLQEGEVEQDEIDFNKFSFEKGAKAGNFLHDVLENQHFANSSKQQLSEVVQQRLVAGGFIEAEIWAPVITDWLGQVLNTPLVLEKGNVALGSLKKQAVLPEMEFHMRVGKNVYASAVNKLIKQHPVISIQGPELQFEHFHGLLKGFIDLTFEVDGQYYICDYKSNHLGMAEQDYSQQAMHKAMAAHRYDAQLIFYTLALHRFLKQQLPDYDYEQHIGGGVYLFLRGMNGVDSQTGVVVSKADKQLIEALDDLLMGPTL